MKPTLLDRVIGYVSPNAALNRCVARDMLSSYRGAVPTRLSNTFPGSTSATNTRAPSPSDQRGLRDRARHLERTNPIAAGVLDRCVENVIGTGIQIEPTTESDEFNKAASDWWETWKLSCDVRGLLHFDAYQRMMFRSFLRDGDIGTVLVDAGGTGKLQPIEGDYLKSPAGKYQGGLTVDGVELNRAGGIRRFWVSSVDEKYKETFTPIAANDFVYLSNVERFTDIRGTSNFKQTFELFDQIAGYFESTVIASRIAAMFALLIKKTNPGGAFGRNAWGTNGNGDAQRIVSMEPGSIKYLGIDEDVTQVRPEHPNQSFPEAIAAFVRPVGLKFGLPLEELLLDYSRANYTVSRAIKMKIQRVADIWQQDFSSRFVSRVYQWAISKALNAGEITVAAPENYWKHEWIPQPLPLVDPNKEIEADRLAVELGVEARSHVARGRGYRFKDLCERNEMDVALLNEHGLPVNTEAAPTADPAQADNPNAATEAITAEMNAYGVAVRAGVLTPQQSDEDFFRSKLNLPTASPDVRKSWVKDEGARRPITITPPPGEAPAPVGGTPPQDPNQQDQQQP